MPQATAAFVLAGGKSSRMGCDKAFLELGGRSLLQHAIAHACSVTDQVWLVGSREKLEGFGRVVTDVYAGHGPLAGIHAALQATSSDLNLVLGVDMPFLDRRFLRFLLQQAAGSDAMVTVPRVGGRWQPLCGVYRKAFAELAAESLRQNCNKIDALFARTPVRVIEESELTRLAFDPAMFDNVNTPEDWERARMRAGEP